MPANAKAEEEQHRKNLLELPGVPLFTPTQEKTREYAARKNYARRQVNALAPFYWKMVGGVTRQEYDGLKESIHAIPWDARTIFLKPNSVERTLQKLANIRGYNEPIGATHKDLASGKTTIEIYPDKIKKPVTATEVIAHEGIHYFDFGRKDYSFTRNTGSEFVNQTVDEIYAQAERFIDFSDPRRSALRHAMGRLSHTSGWETKDPLGLVRTLQCIRQGKGALTAYRKGVGRAKYVLGRAVILELMRQGKVKKPVDVYNIPPEVLKKEITRTVAKSPFIYAGRLTGAILSAPKASLEKISAALGSKKTTATS